jgi:hypothetical protein
MKPQLKVYLTLALLLIFIKTNYAQPNWVWAQGAGNISSEYSNAVCTDAKGNVYATGTFQGSSITFGSYTLNNAGTGTLDIFVVKYDASGNILWAKSMGGTHYDYAYGICTDANSNVYVTGYFRSPSITFGTYTLSNLDTVAEYPDIFISKYDSTGNELWAKSAGNKITWEMSYGICTDTNGNIYITGTYGYNTPMSFGSDTLINRGGYDIFLAKYDAGGNLLWAKSAGGFSYDYGIGICYDKSGNIYVTGYQIQSVFGNDTLTGIGLSAFVAKYDTAGNVLWARNAYGTISPTSTGTAITTDASGNIYITGYFRYSISFGNDTLSNAGYDGIFIAKYDSSGNAQWASSPGGTNYDYSNSICTDASGHVFITGYFSSSFLNFGGFPVLNTNAGYDDIFIAEYDASGNALWATSVGGQDNDFGMGICGNTSGDVYVTGYFGSYSLNFGSTTITNNGSNDIFVAKLSSIVGIEEPLDDSNFLVLNPNPTTNTFTIRNISSNEISSLEIFNPFAEIIYSEKMFGKSEYKVDANFAKGIYFVRVSDGEKHVVKKLIVE